MGGGGGSSQQMQFSLTSPKLRQLGKKTPGHANIVVHFLWLLTNKYFPFTKTQKWVFAPSPVLGIEVETDRQVINDPNPLLLLLLWEILCKLKLLFGIPQKQCAASNMSNIDRSIKCMERHA